MYRPTFAEFEQASRGANVVPVYRQLLADVLTPTSALEKVASGGHSFLLESVVGGEKVGRYSFIGSHPFMTFKATRNEVTLFTEDE
jgi:anthranilate synthase component 1